MNQNQDQNQIPKHANTSNSSNNHGKLCCKLQDSVTGQKNMFALNKTIPCISFFHLLISPDAFSVDSLSSASFSLFFAKSSSNALREDTSFLILDSMSRFCSYSNLRSKEKRTPMSLGYQIKHHRVSAYFRYCIS